MQSIDSQNDGSFILRISHFYRLLKKENNLQLKNVRKTFTTRASISLNFKTHKATGHADHFVVDKFYTDELMKAQSQKLDMLNKNEWNTFVSKL